jgi:hypothetical protein
MKLILKCQKELDKLNKTKSSKEKKLLISKVNDCVIKSIAEISHNCLIGNVPLSSCSYKKLKKYKEVLRKVADKKISIKKKRTVINQRGGFLNILIPAALALLTSVIEKKLNK